MRRPAKLHAAWKPPLAVTGGGGQETCAQGRAPGHICSAAHGHTGGALKIDSVRWCAPFHALEVRQIRHEEKVTSGGHDGRAWAHYLPLGCEAWISRRSGVAADEGCKVARRHGASQLFGTRELRPEHASTSCRNAEPDKPFQLVRGNVTAQRAVCVRSRMPSPPLLLLLEPCGIGCFKCFFALKLGCVTPKAVAIEAWVFLVLVGQEVPRAIAQARCARIQCARR